MAFVHVCTSVCATSVCVSIETSKNVVVVELSRVQSLSLEIVDSVYSGEPNH
jgi:hypothetical protein